MSTIGKHNRGILSRMLKSLNKLNIKAGYRVRLATKKDVNGVDIEAYGINQYAVGIVKSVKGEVVATMFYDKSDNLKIIKLNRKQILLMDDIRIGF